MSLVSITNNTTSQISFEATVATFQGVHETIRALLPPLATVPVTLPPGVTISLLGNCPVVQAELLKGAAARYTIAPAADTNLDFHLASYITFHVVQTAPATAAGLMLGSVPRAGCVARLRLWAETASGVGESYTVAHINKNGVSLGVPAVAMVIPASTAAKKTFDFDLKAQFGAALVGVVDGDIFSLDTTYVAGTPTLTNVHMDMMLLHG